MGERVHEKSFKLIKLFSVIGETTRRTATASLRRPVFSLCARRRSPLVAGGTRYALRPARRGGSSSSQKVLRYFLGALYSFARRSLRAARDTRSAPLGAAAPPLPKKFFDTFWEPYVRGTPLINAANSLFPQKPQVCGQWGALCQKRGFGTRHKLFTLFLLS